MPVQPRDAREASDVFYKQRTGDALLTYENEVIMTNLSVKPASRLPYVVPQYNITVRTSCILEAGARDLAVSSLRTMFP